MDSLFGSLKAETGVRCPLWSATSVLHSQVVMLPTQSGLGSPLALGNSLSVDPIEISGRVIGQQGSAGASRNRVSASSGPFVTLSVAAMIPRIAHVCLCFRKWGSICIDGGVVLLMNTGRSVCDLYRHTLSLFNTHSEIKSATIGGFDWRFVGPP